MQIALDEENNDIIKKVGGGIVRVSGLRHVIQSVRSQLRTRKGEWILNPRLGWLSFDDFKKSPDLFDIEMRATAIIIETAGVKAVNYMELYLKDRVLHLKFEASSIYGSIELDEPWEIN